MRLRTRLALTLGLAVIPLAVALALLQQWRRHEAEVELVRESVVARMEAGGREVCEAAPERFFDDDHYRGYPAVLVRLGAIDEAELAGLLVGAWRILAPKALVRRIEAARSGTANLDSDFP